MLGWDDKEKYTQIICQPSIELLNDLTIELCKTFYPINITNEFNFVFIL